MRLRGVIKEDLAHYKDYTLTLVTPFCNWKCCKEASIPIESCINNQLQYTEIKEYSNKEIIRLFESNQLHSAISIAGLEPLELMWELLDFIGEFKLHYPDVPVIIYTGYKEDEDKSKALISIIKKARWGNIIIKFGRYVPNCTQHKDEILGVSLCCPNQYAKKIS